MRVVAVTKIWPNSLEPTEAAFNRQQFAALARRCELTVLAAVPHVPGAAWAGVPSRAARLSRLPARERVAGVDTVYVRQWYVPRVGTSVALPLYLASLAPHRATMASADVVLGAWAYPDGCAGVLAARALGLPCCVKVHGSDLNVVARHPAARLALRAALPGASAVVAPSRALCRAVVAAGADPARAHHLPNGVDGSLFFPRERFAERRALGVDAGQSLVLFVGHLEPAKGLGELRAAFDQLARARPGVTLALVGDGSLRGELANWARTHGGRVRVLGALGHMDVAAWVGAADVVTLPSWREGTPNAVLEALASGRPVVATSVGGIPDVVGPSAGMLVPPRDARALAAALGQALDREWDAAAIAACAPGSWDESAARLHAILEECAREKRFGPPRW